MYIWLSQVRRGIFFNVPFTNLMLERFSKFSFYVMWHVQASIFRTDTQIWFKMYSILKWYGSKLNPSPDLSTYSTYTTRFDHLIEMCSVFLAMKLADGQTVTVVLKRYVRSKSAVHEGFTQEAYFLSQGTLTISTLLREIFFTSSIYWDVSCKCFNEWKRSDTNAETPYVIFFVASL